MPSPDALLTIAILGAVAIVVGVEGAAVLAAISTSEKEEPEYDKTMISVEAMEAKGTPSIVVQSEHGGAVTSAAADAAESKNI